MSQRQRRSRWLAVAGAVFTAGAVAASMTVAPGPGAAASSGGPALSAGVGQQFDLAADPNRLTNTTDVLLADPDTLQADGTFYTYATTTSQPDNCPTLAGKELILPYIAAGSNSPGLKACATGDAMPGGVGGWAKSGSPIWAPTVVAFNGRYHLYYTATKKGTVTSQYPDGQKCLGVAFAKSPQGPFSGGGEVACPGEGRWALDADAFVDQQGRLVMLYRDDAPMTTGTAISVVQMKNSGYADWPTRRTMLKSSDVDWDNKYANPQGIIENPSAIYLDGRYLVSFSGNNWDSPRYSTGLLDCGSSLFGKCTQIGGPKRPYYGYQGTGGLNPQLSTPWNDKGVGGLSFFQASGVSYAVYHYWTAAGRKLRMAEFTKTSGRYALAPVTDHTRPSNSPTSSSSSSAPTSTTTAPTPGCGPTTYRVSTLNIMSNPAMSKARVTADANKSAALGSDVVFRQEIDPGRRSYGDAVRATRVAGSGKGQWVHYYLNQENPISVREGGDSPWTVVSKGQTLLHGGKARVSPNRYLNWVVAENKNNGQRTAFINTHFVSGAWTSGKTASQWRKDMWNKSYRAVKAQIADFTGRGIDVVYGGDFNRRNMAKFASNEVRLSKPGIDYLGFVPAKGSKVLSRSFATVGGFYSDHNARRAVAQVTQC